MDVTVSMISMNLIDIRYIDKLTKPIFFKFNAPPLIDPFRVVQDYLENHRLVNMSLCSDMQNATSGAYLCTY